MASFKPPVAEAVRVRGMPSDQPAKPKVLPEPKAIAMTGPPPERKPAQEVRKTVTFLFADIVDSSRLSLTLDAEALQNLLARYFGEMSSIIQRHGGSVERYAGDEILAT